MSNIYYDIVNKKFTTEDPGESVLLTPERLRESKIPGRTWHKYDWMFGVSSSKACYVSNVCGFEFEWRDNEEIREIFPGIEPRVIIRNNMNKDQYWFINLY